MEKASIRYLLDLALVLFSQQPEYPHEPREGNEGNLGAFLGGGGALLTLGLFAVLVLVAVAIIRRREVMAAVTILLTSGWGVATYWIFDNILNEAFQYYAVVRGVPLNSQWPLSLVLCFLLDGLCAALVVVWARQIWRRLHSAAHDAGTNG